MIKSRYCSKLWVALGVALLNVITVSGAWATGVLCHVEYNVVVDRGDSYQIKIDLRNVSGLHFDGFELAWRLPAGSTLKQGWNATFSQSEGVVRASNPAGHWNGVLAPFDGLVSFGFEVHNSRPPALELTDQTQFKLNGMNCEDPIITPPTSSSSSSSSSASTSSSSSGVGTNLSMLMDSDYCPTSTGVFETEQDGYEGLGYLKVDHSARARVDYPRVVFLGGPAPTNQRAEYVVVRYANGSDSDRPMALYAGGEKIATLSFAPTGAWTNWKLVRLIHETRIASQISLVAVTSAGGPLIDHTVFNHYIDCSTPEGCGYSTPSIGECPEAPLPGSDLVVNTPPQAEMSVSEKIGHPVLQVVFSAANSTDADGDTLTYTWDFGDGTQASGEEVQHDFAAIGEFTVTLTVHDGKSSDSTSTVVTVVPLPGKPRCEVGVLNQWPKGLVAKDIKITGRDSRINEAFHADLIFSAPVRVDKYWGVDSAENISDTVVRVKKRANSNIDPHRYKFGLRATKALPESVTLQECRLSLN